MIISAPTGKEKPGLPLNCPRCGRPLLFIGPNDPRWPEAGPYVCEAHGLFRLDARGLQSIEDVE